MPIGFVICFSGRIGSGKSSITESLAAALVWRRAGFGDYLRQRLLAQGGDPASREALQDLGQHLVDTDPDQFCGDVLAAAGFEPGQDLLLDGIRHAGIYKRVQKLVAPSQARLIHLAADLDHVRARVQRRSECAADLDRALDHRVEADLQTSLPDLADTVLDANAPLALVLGDCLSAIGALGVAAPLINSATSRLLAEGPPSSQTVLGQR